MKAAVKEYEAQRSASRYLEILGLPNWRINLADAFRLLRIKRRYGLWTTEMDPTRIVYRRRKDEWPAPYVKHWPFWHAQAHGIYPIMNMRRFGWLRQMQELFEENLPIRKRHSIVAWWMSWSATASLMRRNWRRAPRWMPIFPSGKSVQEYARSWISGSPPQQLRQEREITIRIGRDGTAIKRVRHTSPGIGTLLGFEKVPVVVDLVHTQWVKACIRRFGRRRCAWSGWGLNPIQPTVSSRKRVEILQHFVNIYQVIGLQVFP